MADSSHVEKDAETGIADSNYGEDDMEQGIASPVDCWELVGSSPGSPLPEARGDVTALEEAIASACNSSDSLLQNNYFGCVQNQANDAALPASTAMADKQNDDDGHSSERSDGLISLASDTDAVNQNFMTQNDITFPDNRTDNVDPMGHNNGMHYDTYFDDTYHDDLLCHDDPVQLDVDALYHCKMPDECMLYHNELMEHDNKCHIEDETHFEGIMHIDDNSAHCINQSGHSCDIVESTAVASVHNDVPALGLSSGLESQSHSPMSLHGMGDSDMSMQPALVEGTSSNVLSEETGWDVTSQVMQAQDSVDVQHGTINTCNKRQHKGFISVSWIWTQLLRWQNQLRHANTIWSVALTAAVMGILVLGRGWQRLQAQNHSLRSQLWAKEKRITQLMFQLMQTKDALTKVRRIPVICVKSSLQIPQDHS